MKTIFCPVDFSPESQLAAEWAAMLSIKRKIRLVLFNKFNIHSEKVDRKEIEDPLGEARKETEGKLLAFKHQLSMKYQNENLTCDIDTDFGIDTEDVILAAAEKSNADLLVMGTKGAATFGDIINGSNTSNIIRQTHIPVLVIPDLAEIKIPDTIVYATDLKAEDYKNLSFVLKLANELEAKVVFVNIRNIGEHSEGKLENFISDLIASYPDMDIVKSVTYEEIHGKEFYNTLHDFVDSKGGGMVVLGQHPKSFFEKIVKGDFTRLMALYSRYPMLVLHKKN